MSSTNHMSKKSKLNDDTSSKVMFEYGNDYEEEVPNDVTHVRCHPSVVDIDRKEFEGCTKLREVVLNDGLREIGNYAFKGCSALQSINIPSTVIKIGLGAFNRCSSLNEVVLNEGLMEIGDGAFQDCMALESIHLPSTIIKIGYYAFNSCNNLRVTLLNEGLKYINLGAFTKCKSLQSITIPSTVTEIGRSAFYYNTNLREVVLNDGIEMIKSSAFSSTSLERITFPSTVIEIGEHAFSHCTNIREVAVHNERIQIKWDAFINCTLLERFKFPSLSTRLDNIIQAGQRDIEAKLDDISAVEWRSGELIIPVIRREIEIELGMVDVLVQLDKEKLSKIVRLIVFYEIKEATTLFELALWKANLDQASEMTRLSRYHRTTRGKYRIEVPGPVKDTILQYLR